MNDTSLELRWALGHFATGVTIVTTRCSEGTPQGITANSFTSVSLSPPLVSLSISRGLASFDHFLSCSGFAVHVLSSGQEELSSRFARRGGEKWQDVELGKSELGLPVLANRLALFECRLHGTYDGGDHEILIGKVQRFDITSGLTPLLFFQGAYRSIA